MSHLTHLKRNHLPSSAQGESPLRKVKTPLQAFQSPLTEECGDIRIQNKCREGSLNTSHPHRDVRRMTDLTQATIAKFEHGVRWIADHFWEAPPSQEVIMVGQPVKTYQVGGGTRVQNHHTVIAGIKNRSILRQGGGERML